MSKFHINLKSNLNRSKKDMLLKMIKVKVHMVGIFQMSEAKYQARKVGILPMLELGIKVSQNLNGDDRVEWKSS